MLRPNLLSISDRPPPPSFVGVCGLHASFADSFPDLHATVNLDQALRRGFAHDPALDQIRAL